MGEVYGQWTLLGGSELRGSGRKHRYWQCRCACGEERWVRMRSLINEESTSCRRCSKSGNDNTGAMRSWYFSAVRHKAEERGLDFEVTVEDLNRLWEDQGGRCALSGLDLSMCSSFSSRHDQTASLDRIDSSFGYVSGNVQWIHKDINRMKNVFDQTYFIEVCRRIAATAT